MRVLSISCSVLLIAILCIVLPQSVEAKPFIFKFFVPQAPARTDSSSSASSSLSSPSVSTGIDFTSILSTKLNLLTSLLRTGLSSGLSAGFNIGFNKFFPNTQITSTRRPYTSTTTTSPEVEFEPESTTISSFKSTNPTTTTKTTTESYENDKVTGSDILSEPIDNDSSANAPDAKVNLPKNDDNNNSEVTTKKPNIEVVSNSANIETTAKVDTVKISSYGNDSTTPKIITAGNSYDYNNFGDNYQTSNQEMSENEISNEIMMINNQYLPTF